MKLKVENANEAHDKIINLKKDCSSVIQKIIQF